MLSAKQLGEKIVKENPEVFESLMEFEKTGRLARKERANFTIDKTLLNKFRRHCKSKGLNMSALIENFIAETLKKS
jgi:post-segregation antitoxin (ccd killing protein)